MRTLMLRVVTWTTVAGAVVGALSLAVVDDQRHQPLGLAPLASSVNMPIAAAQAGVAVYVPLPAAPASAPKRVAARRH